MEAANRVAANTGILYARMVITIFISLYSTRLVLAALGVSDFGIFNVVGGAVIVLAVFGSATALDCQFIMSCIRGERDEEKWREILICVLLHIYHRFIIWLMGITLQF